MFVLIEDLVKEARADIGYFIEFGQYTYDVLDVDEKQMFDADGQSVKSHQLWV